jgi:hypothetical protein
MGFLDGLGRFLQGKQVFEDEDKPRLEEPQAPPASMQPHPPLLVDEHGYKIIPHITLDHVKAHRDGDRMTVTAWAINHSNQRVRVDHFVVLGQKQTFQRELSPSEGHELKVYEGPVAPNEYESHAELTFRILGNGDLFKNVYHVEFNRDPDGTFIIEELHDDGPVRDI